MTASTRAVQYAELALEYIVSLKLRGREATEIRMNQADYDEMTSSYPSGCKPTLWRLPITIDDTAPVGRPVVMVPDVDWGLQ